MITRTLLFLAASSLSLQVFAQQSVPDWQAKAGGKQSFDVASIRKDTSGKFTPSNIDMSAEDTYTPTGGLFTADTTLIGYITFAYKIWLTPGQQRTVLADQPKWLSTDRYLIQARASNNPTKDQLRLMMQSLLTDRFHLAIHFQGQELSVLILNLDTPGKAGPQLRPHSNGLPCDKNLPVPANRQDITVESFPCNAPMAVDLPDREIFLGFRNSTTALFANFLPLIGMTDRPVIDQTGLTDTFDIALKFAREPGPASAAASEDLPGPTLIEAVKDQLGLQLKPARATLAIPVIDHVEVPSEN